MRGKLLFHPYRDVFVSLYEYSFKPNEYFGTSINKPNRAAGLCFLTEWDIATDDIAMYCYGDFEGRNGKGELTEKEKSFSGIMNQYSFEKYGRNISSPHRPMTDEKRHFFLVFKELDEADAEAYKDTYKDVDDNTEDEEDQECDIGVDILIYLPETSAPDIGTVMTDITAAFAHADIEDWLVGAESWMDDGVVGISFVTGLMGSGDGTDVENFCIERLRKAEKN